MLTRLSDTWDYVKEKLTIAALLSTLGIALLASRLVRRIAQHSLHMGYESRMQYSLASEVHALALISHERLSPQGMSYEDCIAFVKATYSSGDAAEADTSASQPQTGKAQADPLSKPIHRAGYPARNGTATGFGEGGEGLIR